MTFILYYAYIYKCKNTHFFSKSINYHEENLILEYFLMMAWHIVERIIAWEFLKKRHPIRHKRAIDLSRNDKEKTASKK